MKRLPLLFTLAFGSVWAQAQVTTCATESVTLNAPAADAHQWQVQDGPAWSNLTNAGSYTGTQSAALTIDPALLSMDGLDYRCLVPDTATGDVDSVSFVTTLTVLDTLLASTIAFDVAPTGALCHGDNQVTVLQSAAPSGGNGTFDVTWQLDNGSGWQDAGSSTEFVLGNLTNNTTIRQQIESAGACGPVYSNILSIEVHSPLTAPTIQIDNGDDGICYETSPGSLSISTEPTGGSESWAYQWQQLDGTSWVDLPTETALTTTPDPLTSSTAYQVVATEAQCGVQISNVLNIQVFNPLSATMEIASGAAEPLCDDNTGTLLLLTTPPTGGGDGFDFQWFQEGNPIDGANGTSQPSDFLENTASFSLTATSTEGCGMINSNGVTVEVYEPLELDPSMADQTICFGTVPNLITNAGAVGASESYSYQWQQNTGSGWSAIGGETTTEYQPGSLTTTTEYRIVVTDDAGCGTLNGASNTVTVLSDLEAGNVTASTVELCYLDGFTVSGTFATGADGDITNTWYVQLDGDGFAPDAGLTGATWTVDPATVDHDIFIESVSNFGCGTVYSDTLHVEVLAPILEPVIDFPGYDGVPLCFSDVSPGFEVSSAVSGADGAWASQWQLDLGNGFTTNTPGTDPYNPGQLFDTIQVRMESISLFGCGTVYSNTLMVPVWELVEPGVSGPEQLICYDTQAQSLVAQPATGGGGTFTVQWYSNASGAIAPIAGAQGLFYNPGVLTDSTQYFIEYTNTNGCGVVESNTVDINVFPELLPAALTGWDGATLCFYDDINLLGSGIEDYPWLSQQWFAAGTNGAFQELTGFDALTLSNLPLQESTSLYLETASIFGCGTVYSDTVTVTVWDDLAPATISTEAGFDGSTLCFGDPAPLFGASDLASGGGGPLSYEWELDTGTSGSFSSTGVATPLSYAPGNIEDTIAVRLRVIDEYGCGNLLSNPITVNVYAPLAFSEQPETDLVCFGNGPSGFSATATGAGEQYAYQWFNSTDDTDYSPLSGQTADALTDVSLEVDTWFYLELTSTLGCGVIQSDTVTIEVLEELQPGSLSLGTNPICAEEFAAVASSSPSGGFEDFAFEWFETLDSVWTSVQSGGTSYDSDSLFVNHSYYATYTDACGTVTSDTIEITVNPLPVIAPIVGPASPCYSSTDQLYTIPWADLTLDYDWNINPSFGTITSGETVNEVLVDWSDLTGATDLSVVVTNPESACNDEFFYAIEVSDVMAPPASIVVKKPNINILVSADSTECAQYQWGAQNIESGAITYFPALDEQYAFFEVLDTLNFYYFVEVVYDCGDGPSCPTVNWYNYDPFVGLTDIGTTAVWCYPNPASDHVFIDGADTQSLQLFTLQGQRLKTARPRETPFRLTLDDVPAGWYLLSVQSRAGQTESIRLLVQ